jgi:hypothetical protein
MWVVSCTLLACTGDDAAEPEIVQSTDVNNRVGVDEAVAPVVDEGSSLPDIGLEDTTVIVAPELPAEEEVTASNPDDGSSTPLVDSGSTPDLGTTADEGQSSGIPPVITLPPGLVGQASPNNDFITEELLAEVVDETGAAVNLDQVLGHWTVLWFYPKANTSG